MKKINRTVCSAVIIICMCFSCIPSAAAAGPSYGNVYTSVVGTYEQVSVSDILSLVNSYRRSACEAGNVPDPRNPSRMLTASDYVPIRWSGDLEEIAMGRSAEVSLYKSHTRPSGFSFNTYVSSNGVTSCNESYAWLSGLRNAIIYFYENENDYTGGVTHYSMMIDPSNKYMGAASFDAPSFGRYQAIEYNKGSSLDETPKEKSASPVSVDVEMKASGISISGNGEMISGYPEKLNTVVTLMNGMTDDDVHGGVAYTSSAPSVAEVSSDGSVTPHAGGEVTITARVGSYASSMNIFVIDDVDRIYGADRYLTSIEAADAEKELLGAGQFDSAVLASGEDYPDALAGSALAIRKGGPLLLVNEAYAGAVTDYISENVRAGSDIYILGGPVAVPEAVDTMLSDAGFRPVRLYGENRYMTDERIIEEIGASSGTLIVCSGYGYADSLSASGTGLPILLVGEGLSEAQKAFLSENAFTFCIAGGIGAVSRNTAEELSRYGSVERLEGANRYDTSKMIAETFSPSPEAVLLAYGLDFPDGLSGGPLAYLMGGPLMLAGDEATSYAYSYVRDHPSIVRIAAMGGPALVTPKAAAAIRDGL